MYSAPIRANICVKLRNSAEQAGRAVSLGRILPAGGGEPTDPSTRPVAGSRDERMEQKLRVATALVRDLPPTDTRVRLLNIAIMRRDESLLDGVLAELNKPGGNG